MAESKRMSSGETFAAALGYQLAEKDVDLLLWLHAEAVWQREQLDADALKWTEIAGRHAEEIERLHSWAGLMELLDEHWPAAIFPGPADAAEARGDDGPRILALIRAVDAERSSRQAWAEEALREREQYRELLGDIWLYVGWRYVTKQLTAEQKNLWADAVDAVDAFGEPGEDGPKADRWWLDSTPDPITVCACPTDEQLAKLGSGFTRPQCTVHPENGGSA